MSQYMKFYFNSLIFALLAFILAASTSTRGADKTDDRQKFAESNKTRDKDLDHGGHVYVSGEVNNPRRVRGQNGGKGSGISLRQALDAAGGTTKSASGRFIMIVRRRSVFRIDQTLEQWESIRLEEGDLMFIPPKVYLDRK